MLAIVWQKKLHLQPRRPLPRLEEGVLRLLLALVVVIEVIRSGPVVPVLGQESSTRDPLLFSIIFCKGLKMSLFFLSLFLSKIHWPTAIIRNFPQDLVPLVSLRSIECFLFQLTFCVSYWSILKTCWPCWSCAGNVFKICWKENESEKAETVLKIIIICRKYFENVLKTCWKHVELMKTQKKGGG